MLNAPATIETEDLDTDVVDSGDLDLVEYFGEKEVRWFQASIRNSVVIEFANGFKRLLIKAPTGSGKSITCAITINSPELHRVLGIPQDRNLRVVFIAHTHRLLTQAERTFAEDSGVDVIFQSAFSPIPQKVIDEGIDLVVLDEAHHEAMMTIQRQLETIGDYPIIGMTATDERADGCVIKFQKIIEPLTREQAVEQGYLAPTRLHSIVDPTGTNKINVASAVFREYHNEMGQTMVFLKTIKECKAIHELLVSLGKSSVLITNQSERFVDETLESFSRGEIQFIVNCKKINEGVDTKGCTDVFLGRQYGSYPQLNQVIGRAARPDSDCNVWELINPLSGKNLDTTVVVGTPEMHRLLFSRGGSWHQKEFEYTAKVLTSEDASVNIGTPAIGGSRAFR